MSKHGVVQPIHEKLHLCPYCYAKLGFVQRFRKKHNSQVKCPRCGRVINKDRNIVY